MADAVGLTTKLTEEHALTLSVETLRGWMIAAGLESHGSS
jgi:hypothetical protein